MPGIGRGSFAVSLLLLAGAGSAAAQSAPDRTTSDGVYTAEQAARGERVHLEMCSMCHFPEDEWIGEVLFDEWWSRPVRELFHSIRETMPEDFPGTLTRQQYADVVAYIFSLNGMPAGAAELGTDDESLSRILIEKRTP